MDITAALGKARETLEELYDSVCTVFEYEDRKDEITKITSKRLVEKYADIPCRLSYRGFPHTEEALKAARLSFTVRLYLAPEIKIEPGSVIQVTYKADSATFHLAGQPAKYTTHQEIELLLKKGWA